MGYPFVDLVNLSFFHSVKRAYLLTVLCIGNRNVTNVKLCLFKTSGDRALPNFIDKVFTSTQSIEEKMTIMYHAIVTTL